MAVKELLTLIFFSVNERQCSKKFLYIHLAPDHLKGKKREILSLDVNNFKRRCRDIRDADQQRTREAARNINYSVNRSS